jgi:hypothetical protein
MRNNNTSIISRGYGFRLQIDGFRQIIGIYMCVHEGEKGEPEPEDKMLNLERNCPFTPQIP